MAPVQTKPSLHLPYAFILNPFCTSPCEGGHPPHLTPVVSFLLPATCIYFVQVLVATSGNNPAGTHRDVTQLRRVTAAYDAAASRHPELVVDVNRLLSSLPEYMCMPMNGTLEERAEAVISKAAALREAVVGNGGTFSIYSAGNSLVYHTSENLLQRVTAISELLRGVGLCWSDMPAGYWFETWDKVGLETLSANAAYLRTQFTSEELRDCVRSEPNILSWSALNFQKTLAAVAEALEMPVEVAIKGMAATKSSLKVMRVAPETVRGTKAAIVQLLGQEDALALCRRCPAVLQYTSEALLEKWQSLQCVTALRPEWRLEWLEWPQQPTRLLKALQQSVSTHRRLRFLAASQEGRAVLSINLKTGFRWLTMPHAQFGELCPGYKLWLVAEIA